MEPIEGLIERLDTTLKQARPEFYSRLLPGATEAEVADLEEALGFAVPEDFKAFLRWKDGYDHKGQPLEEPDCFVPGFLLLSSADISSLYKGELELYEKYPQYNNKEGFWSPMWIPLLLDNYDYGTCYIDLGGSFTGIIGQILIYYDTQTEIIHKSFSKWLETVVVGYEENIFTFDREDRMESMMDYDDIIEQLNPGYPIIRDRPENPE